MDSNFNLTDSEFTKQVFSSLNKISSEKTKEKIETRLEEEITALKQNTQYNFYYKINKALENENFEELFKLLTAFHGFLQLRIKI